MAEKNIVNYELVIDMNRASIENLKRTLSDVEKNLNQALKTGGPSQELEKSLKAAKDLKKVLNESYKPQLGQFDMSKVYNELTKSYGSVTNFKKALESTSSVGAKAYNEFAKTVLNTNLQLTQSSKLLDSMADTMAKTIKWGIASRVMNNMASSIEKAWDFSVKLDSSLNDIRIVTGKGADEMERFATTANKAAKALGASTRDYTEASLIYYQQGLGDQESQRRAEITLKAANVTGQAAQEVSEQLTAVWNGYNVTLDETELYVDKLAAVAASTAADLEELSTGMSKVASAASTMGVDIDQLNAQMATIVSVTRQAPESVGVALKTIYARMGDIEAGLDEETTLGNYTSKMAQLGVNVLDASGKLRDMGDVVEEIGNKWTDLTREQQVALAQTMAGTRQYNNLLTLFNNWDMYTEALETSANAAGTLQRQQDIYMESTKAHLQQMRTEAEETYKTLFDTKTVNSFIDAITSLNSVLNTFLKGLGGGMNDFVFLGTLLTQIFNKQLANGIDNIIQKFETFKNNQATIAMFKSINEEGFSTAFGQQGKYVTEATSAQLGRNAELLQLQPGMKNEDFNKLNMLSQEIAYYQDIVELKELAKQEGTSETKELEKQIADLETQNQILRERINLTKKDGGSGLNKQILSKWASEDNVFTKTERNRIKDILGESEGRALTQQQIVELTEMEEKAQNRINVVLQGKYKTQDKIKDAEEMTINQAETEKAIREDIYKQLVKQQQRQQNMGNMLAGLSSIVQFGTIISGMGKTIKDVTDGTIKWSEALSQLAAVAPMAIASGIQAIQALAAVPPQVLITVAAIAALTAGIAFMVNEISLAIDKDRVLNEELKRNKKAVEECRQAYEELKSTVSNYKDASEAIDSLTEGTLEFYEAILQANEQAQKLIELLNLQAGIGWTMDSNGRIQINEEALEQGMFEEAQKWYKSQLNQSTTEFLQKEKERNNQVKDITKQFQEDVSSLTKDSGYGISYEQAELMIDQMINTKQATINLGELEHQYITNAKDDMVDGLCQSIDDAANKVIAPLEEIKVQRDSEAQKLGADAIRAYGNKEQIQKLDNLPEELKNVISQDVGSRIGDLLTYRKEAGLEGRHIGNDFWRTVALQGFTINNKWKIDEENYQKTRAIPQEVVEAEFEERMATMLDGLNRALEKGYTAEAGGKYMAQAYYEATYNDEGKVSDKTLQMMTSDELKAALESSRMLRETLIEDNDLMDASAEKTQKAINDYINSIKEASGPLDEFGRTQERITADLEDYKNGLEEAARELEVSTKTMELYGEAAVNAGAADKRKDAATANSIKRMASFNKTYNETIKIYDDNEDAIKEYANAIKNQLVPSLEAAAGAADLLDKLEEMGLNLTGTQLANNLETINTLLNGTEEEAEEAYKELEKISLLNILEGFDTSAFDELENGILGFVNELANANPGAQLSDDYAAALRTMINNSQMTREQIYELLDSLHLQGPNMDVNLQEHVKETDPEIRRIEYSGSMPDVTNTMKSGKAKNVRVHYFLTETIQGQKFRYFTLGDGQSFVRTAGPSGGSFARAPSNSGGGGGGGGGNSEPKQVDYNDEEADRYHEIDTQIKEYNNSLKQIQSQTKKLVGTDLIENLNKQWELLNKQVDNYNEKLKIAEGEQAELRSKLANQGVVFNADGTIGNYVQAFKAQQAQLNNVIAYYNSLSSEGQKSYQATLDAAQEKFKQFQKDMDRYDTLVSDFIPGLYESIQDAIDKQIDIQIQEFDMEIEIRLKTSEAERDWNDFKKKIIDGIKDDDILGNAMAKLVDFSSYYKEDNTGAAQALRKQIDDTLKELYQMDETGTSRVYGDNRTKALEDLKKYYDELRKQMQDILALQEEIHQSYIDMMNEAQEKFNEQIQSYEMISKLIEHDKKVISMVYGEDAYRQLSAFYDKQEANYKAQLDFQKQQTEFWKEQMEAAEAGSEAWDEAKEKWAAATEELNSLIETSIENLEDKYLNAINAIFQDLNNKVTSGAGLDYVEEEWNLINKNAEQYLDNINRLYGIQALENKYLDAINDNDNIAAQRQLKKIMDEELKNLRERDKLTQYDIERANKKYEIALKQIALEEAQQNKTQLRLRRDTQGNYRYEFISDIDQVNQLQNDLDDLYNSLYNFDKENYTDNLNQLYDVWKEFQDKMAEAAQINDPQARAERELLIQEQYGEMINGLVEQNETIRGNLYDSAFEDLARLYDEDKNNFLEMTQAEQDALMNDLIPYWDAGVQHMADVFAGEGGFIPTCEDAIDELHEATKEYEDGLKEVENTANISFDNIGNGIDDVIDRTQELLKDNDDLINSYREEMDAIGGVVDELDNLVDKYQESADAAKAAEKAAYDYWSEQQRQAAEAAARDQAEKERKAAEEAAKKAVTPAPTPTPAPAPSNNGGGDGVPRVGDVVTYNGGGYFGDSYGGSGWGNRGPGGRVTITRLNPGAPYPIHVQSSNSAYGWLRQDQISGYDTGGYTGEWGPTGRFALLHQKELVLNQQDTKNLLNAVNVMRMITNNIGSKVLDRLNSVSATGGFNGSVGGILDQNVNIQATFPNVKDHNEIEEALNNLVNRASQFVQNKER